MALPSGVTCILAPNPSLLTGPGTNTYVVAGRGGCVVIDPGPLIESHLAEVADVAARHGGAQAILVTHGHPDHAGGAARLRELTGAPILAYSRDGVAMMDAALADGDEVTACGRKLIALYTPGHRFDHLCFLLPDAQALFAGDLVAGTGTVVIAPPEGDLAAYMASLRRLQALDVRQILPGHGPAIDDPAALLAYYIQHRNEREQQVLAGLDAGARTVGDLVARIYADVDREAHPVAALTITAHLLKLEGEGRVIRQGNAGGEDLWQLSAPDRSAG